MIRSLAAQHLVVAGVDLILPPRCLVCGGAVPVQMGELCEAASAGDRLLGAASCRTCGLPGGEEAVPSAPPTHAAAAAICRRSLDRLRARWPTMTAAAPGAQPQARRAPEGVARMARWLARAGADILGERRPRLPGAAAPLAAGPPRFNRRPFWVARLAADLGRTFVVACIRLERPGDPYPAWSAPWHGDEHHLVGAFGLAATACAPARGASSSSSTTCSTTGATLGACAAALRGAGADRGRSVLARVVGRPGRPISREGDCDCGSPARNPAGCASRPTA